MPADSPCSSKPTPRDHNTIFCITIYWGHKMIILQQSDIFIVFLSHFYHITFYHISLIKGWCDGLVSRTANYALGLDTSNTQKCIFSALPTGWELFKLKNQFSLNVLICNFSFPSLASTVSINPTTSVTLARAYLLSQYQPSTFADEH